MTSVIKVDNIQNSSGTAALSIDSSGRVTMANTVEIDIWRLNANWTTASADITSGWERSDDATSGYAGTGMTESSGYFTFPSSGLWKLTGCFFISIASGDTSAGVLVSVSTDSGSTWQATSGGFESQSINTSLAFQTLINVTNASTFRVKFTSNSLASGTYIVGNTNRDYTTLIFERITDSQ